MDILGKFSGHQQQDRGFAGRGGVNCEADAGILGQGGIDQEEIKGAVGNGAFGGA